MDVADVIGAAFLPTDGQANPSDITQSLAKGARMAGAQSVENVEVTGIRDRDAAASTACVTGQGPNRLRERRQLRRAMGARARRARRRQRAARAGAASIHRHRAHRRRDARTCRPCATPTGCTYYKEEVGGLVMGGYEPNPIPWAGAAFPRDFDFQLLPPISTISSRSWSWRWAAFRRWHGRRQAAHQRPRKLHPRRQFHPRRSAGTARLLRRRRLQRLRHRLGRRRRQGAGGMGRGRRGAVRSLARRHPPLRPQPSRISTGCARARWRPTAGITPSPGRPRNIRRGRPLRRSPLYDRLKAQGAVFGEKLGWERPNWFADASGETSRGSLLLRRPNWFDAVAREHHAAREHGGAVRPDAASPRHAGRARCRERAVLDRRQRRRQARRAA